MNTRTIIAQYLNDQLTQHGYHTEPSIHNRLPHIHINHKQKLTPDHSISIPHFTIYIASELIVQYHTYNNDNNDLTKLEYRTPLEHPNAFQNILNHILKTTTP